MSTTRTRVNPPDFVPADYSELFQHYYGFVKALVIKYDILPNNVEDVSMAILEKFFQNDVLRDYDPEFTSTHDGVVRKALFRTFLSGFVKSYVRHHRERQYTTSAREPIIVDGVLLVNGESIPWRDVHAYALSREDSHDEMYDAELVESIRVHLKTVQSFSRCPLPDLFEACLAHAEWFGRPDTKQLALQFEVSENTIRARMKALRGHVGEVLGE